MKKISIATGPLITLLLTSLSAFAQTQSRADILKQIETKRAELAALEKSFLAPSEEDQAAYADFLHQPKTGLIRLLPREKYDGDTYKKNKKALTMRGGGAYYSFSRKTHEYGFGSDISLDHDQFVSGFTGGDSGTLAFLGDVPLESVTFETPEAQALATPVTDRRSSTSRLPFKPNSTYLVRAIDFRKSDVLVAFRVVRVDNDGSAIILWKLLKSFPVNQVAENN